MSAAIGSPPAAALGTSGNPIPADPDGGLGNAIPKVAAIGRHELRDSARHLWFCAGVDEFRSLRLCGVSATPRPDGPAGVQLRLDRDGGRVAVTGTNSCGNTRVCPVCAPRVLRKRSDEIREITSKAFAQGMRVAFLTGTLRHRRGQSVEQQRAAIEDGWRAVTQGRAWKDARDVGVVGTVRGLEIQLCGPAGAHTHVHGLVFFAAGTSDATIERVMDTAGERWRRRAAKHMDGLRPSEAHGWEWELLEDAAAAGDYVTKAAPTEVGWSPADEVARGDLKKGKNGSVSPLQLLAIVVSTGDAALARVLVDFTRAMRGARTILVSRGLRDALGIDRDERSDEELASELEDVRDWRVVASLSPEAWTAITRSIGVAGAMRAVLEHGDACLEYLWQAADAGRTRSAPK